MRFARPVLVLVLLAACNSPRSSGTPAAANRSATPAPTPPSTVTPPPVPEPPLAPASPGVDPCLLGTWRLTPENALAFYRRILGRANAPIEVTAVTGGSSIVFNADGTTSMSLTDLQVTYRVTGGEPVQVTVSVEGTGSARYSAQGGTVTYTESSSDFRGSAHMTIGGRDTEMPWNASMGEAFGQGIRGDLSYTCTPQTLVATPVNVEGAQPVTWVR